jgi:hypothetical protein
MADETTIIPPDEKKTRAKPKAKAKSKAPAITPKEVGDKLHIIMQLVAKVSGRNYEYTTKDWDQEAAGLVRLSEKYEVVAMVVNLFDPLMVLAGLITKFTSMDKIPGAGIKKLSVKQPPKEPETNLYPMQQESHAIGG